MATRRGLDVGLPIRPFLYTLDQIADLLAIELKQLQKQYVYFTGISTGGRPKDRLLALNIAPDDSRTKDWRVSEAEFKRWLRFVGLKVYDRASVRV